MPLTVDDVRVLLSTAILEAGLAQSDYQANQLAQTLAGRLTPSLNAAAGPGEPAQTGALMTAKEALFIRDAVAAELASDGGGPVAERLLMAGYIDVGPILLRHRMLEGESPQQVAAATGPLRVPGAPSSATETGRIARRIAANPFADDEDGDD